jgi:hypothetical protein
LSLNILLDFSQLTFELENGQADFILFIEEGNLSLNSLPLA